MAEQSNQAGQASGPRISGSVQVALWLIVVLLAVNATVLLLRPESVAWGQAATPGVGQDNLTGLFVVPGQITKDLWGAYVIDSRAGTIVLYQYNANSRKLTLAAARSMIYDRYLKSYNTDPSPDDIAELLAQERRPGTARPQDGSKPPAESGGP